MNRPPMTRRHVRTGLRAGLLLAALLGQASPLGAQDWVTREQDALWVGAFLEQPVTERVNLWFDGSWRRMDFGVRPQQLLLRPGVLVTVAPGVKIGGGMTYVATAPYGNLPIANPTRDTRTWQTLQLTHKAGTVDVHHRFMVEQRWIRPLIGDSLGPATYANRIRYRARGQMPLGAATLAGRPLYGFVWDELLMPFGGVQQQFTIGQNRATIGMGVGLSSTTRVEVGYMNLYNAFPGRRANEVNHTLWLSWHYTGAARSITARSAPSDRASAGRPPDGPEDPPPPARDRARSARPSRAS